MARKELILDRYEVLGTAGSGGFGTVRIAWDPRIQRKVAIKTIQLTELDAIRAGLPGAGAVDKPAAPGAPDDAGAFTPPWEDLPDTEDGPAGPDEAPEPVTALAHLPGLDEARTAAMLHDPRIVTVYDFEVRDRTAYLIMEYVEGITLTRLLAAYPDYLTLDIVAAVFDAVAGALAVAHKAGVLHLDIKPDNIIVNAEGQAKVTDFGLATLADASGAGTTGGGTVGYMPLEQMRREHLDARTDEWSLAAVAYEMLTGSNPFRAPDLEAAEGAILNAELVLPSLCWNDLDDQIDDVVFYALDPERDERYASVADFAEEMEKFLGDPAEGRAELAAIVQDALGMAGDEPAEDEEPEEEPRNRKRPKRRRGFLRSIIDAPAETTADAAGLPEDEPVYDDDSEPEPVTRRAAGPRRATGLRDRFGSRSLAVLARAFGAAGSGFAAYVAASGFPPLGALGAGGQAAMAAAGVVGAVCGAVFPHLGALVSLSLMGLSIAFCGHPIVGAVVIVAVASWWYAVGHEGSAAANAALLLPLAGAIGGSSAVSLVSGASLAPLRALATTALAALLALVYGALGSGALTGWDAFANWDFAHVDITGNLVAMLTRPGTWTTIAGWCAASLALSALSHRGSRGLALVGLAVAVALLLAGSLAFSAPTPQLIVSVALAAAALVAVVV